MEMEPTIQPSFIEEFDDKNITPSINETVELTNRTTTTHALGVAHISNLNYLVMTSVAIMILILIAMCVKKWRATSESGESSHILPSEGQEHPITRLRSSFIHSFQLRRLSSRPRERLDDQPPTYDDIHGEEFPPPPAYKDL